MEGAEGGGRGEMDEEGEGQQWQEGWGLRNGWREGRKDGGDEEKSGRGDVKHERQR